MSRKNVAPSALRIVALLVAQLATACSAGDVSRPAVPGVIDTNPPPVPPVSFVQPTRPATIYMGAQGIYQFLVSTYGGPVLSRYVVYEDNTFALQFFNSSRGQFEYTGRLARSDSVFDLRFDGWSIAGPWIATGALRGDTLSVSYNTVMMLSDFADGYYVRVR